MLRLDEMGFRSVTAATATATAAASAAATSAAATSAAAASSAASGYGQVRRWLVEDPGRHG